jgi:peptidyl-tRNA hydrolase, PTH1 family
VKLPVKLIVGLGNPGAQYKGTRHNIGFAVIDEIARRAAVGFESAPAEAVIAKWRRPEGGALLAKPLTFMNRSGEVVGPLARYYDVAADDVLVVVDEAALPFGKLRARARGSAGGHNGLKSVIEGLGTTEFPRLRVGVGRGDGRRDLADHVLARFESGEKAELEGIIARAADAVEMFAAADIAKVMNTYNPDTAGPELD